MTRKVGIAVGLQPGMQESFFLDRDGCTWYNVFILQEPLREPCNQVFKAGSVRMDECPAVATCREEYVYGKDSEYWMPGF